MREQLIQYVQLLFAGANDCEDVKQEILQNTLDRYDDLISQGKVPEAAYRLAIAGIGDINEILGDIDTTAPVWKTAAADDGDTPKKKLLRAIAVGLYILCPIPLIGYGNVGMGTFGLCGTLLIVAIATVLIILGAKKDVPETKQAQEKPESQLRKSIHSVIWTIGLVLYFLISFLTGAWYITWVMFPLIGAVQGLSDAIMDLKEVKDHET